MNPLDNHHSFALIDELRSIGWSVAVHNDYKLNGKRCTFWLLTRGDLNNGIGECVKGEGETDYEAICEIYRKLGLHISINMQSE